jgi:hypothetical protein
MKAQFDRDDLELIHDHAARIMKQFMNRCGESSQA